MSAPTPGSSTVGDVKFAPLSRQTCRVKNAAQNARFAIYALVAVVGGLL